MIITLGEKIIFENVFFSILSGEDFLKYFKRNRIHYILWAKEIELVSFRSNTMTDPFFKIRPSKRSNPEARTTLDTVHQHYLTKVKDIGEQVTSWKEEHSQLHSELQTESCDIERFRLEQHMNHVKNKIDSVDEKDAIFNYYLHLFN